MVLSGLERFYLIDDGFFSFNIKYLFFVGLWPEKTLTRNQKFLYKIYELFIHAITIIFLIMAGVGTYQNKDDILIVLSNLDKSLVVYNFFFKTIIFLIKRDQLSDLIDEIEASGDIVTKERKKLMANYVMAVTILTAAVVSTFSLLALLEGIMSIEAWMPFDPVKNSMSLVLSLQIIAFCVFPGLCRAFAMQGLVCSMIMYLCDQLIHLQKELRSLDYVKDTEMITRMKFKMIIKKHIRLMGYSMKMESIFNEYFLVQNLAVTVELCLNAVMVSIVGVQQITLLFTFLAYLVLALINAYVYCYLGNELIIQSEGIALAAYESTWTSWPVDLQKDLLIVINASQRPLKLSAGGIALLSIQTFSQALYNGYSIFAVLNDVVN
ncbi:odorant receptor 30a-like [Spodoptera litura]|uniref:Odorant receptor n=1 Tax=Spodoptera litura TaxID=69820 RepID=A0A9J7EB41_SPOLT|nr:odorant receptor 30a-like [Spodoptera litura]